SRRHFDPHVLAGGDLRIVRLRAGTVVPIRARLGLPLDMLGLPLDVLRLLEDGGRVIRRRLGPIGRGGPAPGGGAPPPMTAPDQPPGRAMIVPALHARLARRPRSTAQWRPGAPSRGARPTQSV